MKAKTAIQTLLSLILYASAARAEDPGFRPTASAGYEIIPKGAPHAEVEYTSNAEEAETTRRRMKLEAYSPEEIEARASQHASEGGSLVINTSWDFEMLVIFDPSGKVLKRERPTKVGEWIVFLPEFKDALSFRLVSEDSENRIAEFQLRKVLPGVSRGVSTPAPAQLGERDLKMANGYIYHDVNIAEIAADGVRAQIGGRTIKYWWRHLYPSERPRMEKIEDERRQKYDREKEEREAAALHEAEYLRKLHEQ